MLLFLDFFCKKPARVLGSLQPGGIGAMFNQTLVEDLEEESHSW